uniref:Tricarboxylate transporter n=2 Tax=Pseudomonadati TaxID=3379134 RepID=A0A2G7T917_9FLAO
MDELQYLAHGFAAVTTWQNTGLMLTGILLGIVVGVLPGLGGPNGVAILLPLTFGMSPTSAIILLSCIYWGALFGGAITSVLFNIPGEAWSVATTFDGYPMAQQGHAGAALTTAFTGSFIGAISGVMLITFLAPVVASFALQFGPPEFFAVFFLTFCSFIGMGKEPKAKIVAAMAVGLLLAAVGMDTISGDLRMTFGSTELLRGFDFLVVVIGLFGISEILMTIEEGLAFKGKKASIDLKVVFRTWAQLPRYWLTMLRSALVGCWMGVTPGGAVAASFMGYGLAKKFSRDPDSFGKGNPEGVLAPRDRRPRGRHLGPAAHAGPGHSGLGHGRLLLGGLMIWGLQPGPLLFTEQKDFVWGLIASMYLGNIAGLVIVMATVPLFAAILRVPFSIVAPMILMVCAIGAFTVHGNATDIWLMLVFGVVGYVFKKLDYPLAPMVLAIVLGDRMEDAFRQSMLSSQGALGIFWHNGLSGTITTLALLMLVWPLLGKLRAMAFGARARAVAA